MVNDIQNWTMLMSVQIVVSFSFIILYLFSFQTNKAQVMLIFFWICNSTIGLIVGVYGDKLIEKEGIIILPFSMFAFLISYKLKILYEMYNELIDGIYEKIEQNQYFNLIL